MKKAFLNKVISAFIAASTIGALVPLGVSAQVNNNSLSNQNGQWYYSTNSTTQKGLVSINGTKYYLNKSGIKQTGWIKDNGRVYYADNTGVIQTGIVKINGNIYYFNTNGVMQTGIVRIGNVTYTFSSDGQAIGNRIPTCNKEFDSNNSLVKPNQGNSNGTSTDNSVNNNQNSSGSITTPGNSGSNTGSSNNSSTGSTGTGNTAGSGVNVSGLPVVTQKYSATIQSSAETKILELMNEKRKAAGLQPLTMDNTLLDVARYKSNHMIQNNYFSHTNPDGTNWTSWLKKLGYKYNATAENIAYNTSDPVELFNQWWNSSGHRENMMNSSYTKVGIGVVYGNGKYMGTQTFSN